mmetsp:Transcript_80012/g.235345  ORF Transcript_80012/g.235345 Transcript_80012/m.235345 type:complete len:216 (+) Transcript_80012:1286-1933(+)
MSWGLSWRRRSCTKLGRYPCMTRPSSNAIWWSFRRAHRARDPVGPPISGISGAGAAARRGCGDKSAAHPWATKASMAPRRHGRSACGTWRAPGAHQCVPHSTSASTSPASVRKSHHRLWASRSYSTRMHVPVRARRELSEARKPMTTSLSWTAVRVTRRKSGMARPTTTCSTKSPKSAHCWSSAKYGSTICTARSRLGGRWSTRRRPATRPPSVT